MYTHQVICNIIIMISVNSLILFFFLNLFKAGQVAVKLMRGQGVEDIRSDDEDEDPKLLGDWEIICYFNEWCMMNHLSWFSDGNHSSCIWFWYDWVLNHIFFTKLGLSMVQRKSCDSDHLCLFLKDSVHIKMLRFFFEITSLTSPTSHSWRPSHLQEEELRSSVSEYGNTSLQRFVKSIFLQRSHGPAKMRFAGLEIHQQRLDKVWDAWLSKTKRCVWKRWRWTMINKYCFTNLATFTTSSRALEHMDDCLNCRTNVF